MKTKWIERLLLATVICLPMAQTCWAQGDGQSSLAKEIRRLGLEARVDASVRDVRIQRIAFELAKLAGTGRDMLRRNERVFQEALMLVCDTQIYETLSAETIAAVDAALERVFDLPHIQRSTEWEPLIYVYGFFNRNVTVDAITDVRDAIAAIPEADLNRLYVTYPHTVDAVCKPLAMGPLESAEATAAALEAAVPMLKEMLTQPPLPGRAFHPPSHAALILPPLYDRWAGRVPEGEVLRAHLGDRDAFARLLYEQLVGGREKEAPLEEYARGYYAYTGRYLANALARFDARDALPALKKSLAAYRAWGASGATIRYTERALVALGGVDARADFERKLDGAERESAVATLVWLCRNGRDETLSYAARLLGEALDVDADAALDTWFKRQLASLTDGAENREI